MILGKSKFTDEELIAAVQASSNFTEVLNRLGIKMAGGSHTHYKNRVIKIGCDVSHFTGSGHNKGKKFTKVCQQPENVLVLRSSGGRQRSQLLRKCLISIGVPYECSKCYQKPNWLGNSLTLDIDHKNCNWLDDRAENLRFLCPNCHSQFTRNLIKTGTSSI